MSDSDIPGGPEILHGTEKRRHHRFIVESLDVKCKMMRVTEAKLINISLGGAFIYTPTRLNIGSDYSFRVECGEQTLNLKGTVAWERVAHLRTLENGDKHPTYEVGVRFKDVLTGSGADLIDFMDKNVAENPFHMRLQGLRVKILKTEKTSILDHHSFYKVKKLSRGGMLIEVETEFEPEERFRMECLFPDDDHSLQFVGRIAYSARVPASRPPVFDTGIEFFDMSDDDAEKLQAFIDALSSDPAK